MPGLAPWLRLRPSEAACAAPGPLVGEGAGCLAGLPEKPQLGRGDFFSFVGKETAGRGLRLAKSGGLGAFSRFGPPRLPRDLPGEAIGMSAASLSVSIYSYPAVTTRRLLGDGEAEGEIAKQAQVAPCLEMASREDGVPRASKGIVKN